MLVQISSWLTLLTVFPADSTMSASFARCRILDLFNICDKKAWSSAVSEVQMLSSSMLLSFLSLD